MTAIEQPTNARGRRTRAALLDGARAILESQGFDALTMEAVAARAGVTRRAAYLHFSSRHDLVAALFDHIAEREGLAESLEEVWRAPDAVGALQRWAVHLARYHPALIEVDRAITHVEVSDADAAAHRARITAAQRRGCTRLARWLADDGRLAAPWTVRTASDLLFGLIATDMIARLLRDCDWTETNLARRLALLLQRTLTEAGA